MGVDGKSFLVEGLAHDDGGCFVADAGESLKLRKGGGDAAVMFSDEDL